MAAGPLPVTVVGGYLGAGKTTLVNSLLRQANGRRLAVMVNEFGALPIDASLVEAADERIVSLVGGCVCCSYGEDLVSSLAMLAALEPRPEHVLLEASGVAFPGAIAGTVGLLTGFELDGAVVLADAETVRGRAADRYIGSTVRRQLAQADLILLNKCDLAGDADAVEAWLGEAALDARVVRTVQSDAPIDIVLGRIPAAAPARPAAGRSTTRAAMSPPRSTRPPEPTRRRWPASSPTRRTACCGPRASLRGPTAGWPRSRPSAAGGRFRTPLPTRRPASSASASKAGQTSPPSGGQSAVPDINDHRLEPLPIAAGKLLPRLREAGWGAASAPAAGGIVPEDCRRIGLSTEDDVEAGKQ